MRWTEDDLRGWQAGRQSGGKGHRDKAAHKRRPAAAAQARETPSEDEEQIMLFAWAAWRMRTMPELNWLYHIPNGGSRNRAEAGKLRAMGVRQGVPDVALDVARGEWHGLRIELKRRDGGRLSAAQQIWLRQLTQHGYRAEVCRGWEAAAQVIEDYLRS